MTRDPRRPARVPCSLRSVPTVHRPVPSIVAGLMAVLLAVAAGCGGEDSEEEDVTAAVERFTAAIEDGDAAATCESFSAATVEDLEASGTCEDVLDAGFGLIGEQEVQLPDLEVSEVTVDGDRAEATLLAGSEESPLTLVREDDEWRVEGASSFDDLHPDDPIGAG